MNRKQKVQVSDTTMLKKDLQLVIKNISNNCEAFLKSPFGESRGRYFAGATETLSAFGKFLPVLKVSGTLLPAGEILM